MNSVTRSEGPIVLGGPQNLHFLACCRFVRQYHASAPSQADGKRKIEVEYSLGRVDNTTQLQLGDEPAIVQAQVHLLVLGYHVI